MMYGMSLPGTGKLRDGLIDRLITAMGGTNLKWGVAIPEDATLVVSFRQRILPGLDEARSRGAMTVLIDKGHFDDTRNTHFSISINGEHGYSQSVDVDDLPSRPHPEIQRWRVQGDHIQIIYPGWSRAYEGTVPWLMPEGWAEDMATQASAAFDLPALIRYHPSNYKPGVSKPCHFHKTFHNAYASITYCSTSAIQTVLAGVPTITFSERSVAYPVTSHDLSIYLPDRTRWVHEISYRNYDMIDPVEIAAAADYILMAYEQLHPKVR